jgi:ABC-type nitrate/sulfonate/bicarbonate transport system substrate-binding protein
MRDRSIAAIKSHRRVGTGLRLSVALIAVSVVAAACSSGPSNSASSNGSTEAVANIPQYGSNSGNNVAEYYLGLADGTFTKYHINAPFFTVSSSQELAPLVSGQEAVGQLSGTAVLDGIADGAPLVAVANIYPHLADVVMAAPSITSLQQLKGQEFPVTSSAGLGVAQLALALQGKGMSLNDVKLLPLGNKSNILAAALSGKVNLDAANVGVDTITLQQHGWHLLLDEASENVQFGASIVVTTRSEIQHHRQVVQDYVDAMVAATKIFETNEKAAMAIETNPNYFPGQTEAQGLTSYNYFKKYIPCYPTISASQFAAQLTLAKSNNPALSDPKLVGLNMSKHVDDSFVKAAEAAKIGC